MVVTNPKLKNYLQRYNEDEQSTMELEIQALRPGGETFDAVIEFSPTSFEGEPCTQIMIRDRSEEHTSELQSHHDLVCRLRLEKKKKHL